MYYEEEVGQERIMQPNSVELSVGKLLEVKKCEAE